MMIPYAIALVLEAAYVKTATKVSTNLVGNVFISLVSMSAVIHSVQSIAY